MFELGLSTALCWKQHDFTVHMKWIKHLFERQIVVRTLRCFSADEMAYKLCRCFFLFKSGHD